MILNSWLLLIVQCLFLNIDSDSGGKYEDTGNLDDKKLKEAFERWKTKPYALTVPLRIVALRGSIPPSWVKVCGISCTSISFFVIKKGKILHLCLYG